MENKVRLLDQTLEALNEGPSEHVLSNFFMELRKIRDQLSKKEWKAYTEECQKHPIMEIFKQDPFTNRCLQKPRGYPGDAVMMDYMYEHPSLLSSLKNESQLGIRIYQEILKQPELYAGKARKEILTKQIDQTAKNHPFPKILSLACGHLREAESSQAVKENRIDTFIAIDQDDISLEEINKTWTDGRITTVCSSLSSLLQNDTDNNHYDLIYVSGLYDYLKEDFAIKLTTALFNKIKPGGNLLIANFSTETQNAAYMEAIMDWWLIYRNENDMKRLTSKINTADMKNLKIFTEKTGCIIFMNLSK